jgi:hypothetical protein
VLGMEWRHSIQQKKVFTRYEIVYKSFQGMKQTLKVQKKHFSMKLFFRVWKSSFWVWKKTNFCKFPISYPRVWKYRLFFPDGFYRPWISRATCASARLPLITRRVQFPISVGWTQWVCHGWRAPKGHELWLTRGNMERFPNSRGVVKTA